MYYVSFCPITRFFGQFSSQQYDSPRNLAWEKVSSSRRAALKKRTRWKNYLKWFSFANPNFSTTDFLTESVSYRSAESDIILSGYDKQKVGNEHQPFDLTPGRPCSSSFLLWSVNEILELRQPQKDHGYSWCHEFSVQLPSAEVLKMNRFDQVNKEESIQLHPFFSASRERRDKWSMESSLLLNLVSISAIH